MLASIIVLAEHNVSVLFKGIWLFGELLKFRFELLLRLPLGFVELEHLLVFILKHFD